MTNEKVWVGIDVSKKTFNAAIDLDGKIDTPKIRTCGKFDNSKNGVEKFFAWLGDNAEQIAGRQVCMLMEATGVYSRNLHAELLKAKGFIY